jgi:putative two-component system response regulator
MGHSEFSGNNKNIYAESEEDFLEELEELSDDKSVELPEELEELSDDEQASYDLTYSKIFPETIFKIERKKYEKAPVPVMFLTNKLEIYWSNESCSRFINTAEPVERSYLYQLFSPYLNEKRMNVIYRELSSKENGYSWRGKAELSGRHRITSISNLMIFPFFSVHISGDRPDGYIVFIDDLTEDNNQMLRNTFKSLLDASKLKDNDTGNHIERVCQYSQKIASSLYNRPGYEVVDIDFIMNISYLAAMHDVGKIGTPDDILNKPGPLTDLEWEIMKEHTINGAFILSSYPHDMAVEIARSHHEKWDGSGYPYKLAGEDIPLSARIVTIADVYDALRMKRVYKDAFSHEKAFSIILEGKGKHFDPDLIDITTKIEEELDVLFTKLSDKKE